MILDEFKNIYHIKVENKINHISNNYDCDWEPVIYTLNNGRNRFRAALAIISGQINQLDENTSATIGAISELLHTVIIMQDDIADNDDFRRGDISAWKRFGIDRVIFCCEQVISVLLINSMNTLNQQATYSLLETIYKVNRGQLMQCKYTFSENCPDFMHKNIHEDKTALGRWSLTCPCTLKNNDKVFSALDKFSRLLGNAGSIKNDLENVLLDNSYDSVKTDASCKRLNIPLSRVANLYPLTEDFSKEDIKRIIMENGIYEKCKEEIELYVATAIQTLEFLPNGEEKELLIKWAKHHLDV